MSKACGEVDRKSPPESLGDQSATPSVRTSGRHKVMHFGACDVQSEMDTSRPSALVLGYTRLMMAFLLVQPEPQRVLMIGLGGGSLAKFCHLHLPFADITVVELNPLVVELRDEFNIPRDDHRFRVVLADGADYVARHDVMDFDVVLVDGFIGGEMPRALGSTAFYDHCRRILSDEGVVVCNLHARDVFFDLYAERLLGAFAGQALFVESKDIGNCIALAGRTVGLNMSLPDLLQRPVALSAAAWAELQPAMTSAMARAKTWGRS